MTVGTIDDVDMQALLDYWLGKCDGATIPARADIDPTEIPKLLPHLFIAEVHYPLRFRFRLIGSAICERWGENATGKFLDEIALDGERATVMAQYTAVAETNCPRFDSEEFVNEHGRYLHYRRLLLPLSDDGGPANRLLGCQKAIGVDGYRVSPPKWI